MSKRPADEDASPRKCATLDQQLVTLPAELIEMIARVSGPSGFRNLAATCRRARQVLTLDAARQERAKDQFSKLDVRVCHLTKEVTTCMRLPNGGIHGMVSCHSTVTGNLIGIAHWIDGRQHGIKERWHESGERSSRREYSNGLMNGVEEIWNNDGVLVAYTPYKMGERFGFAFRWHNDGSLRAREYYYNGKKNGLYEQWDPLGHLIQRDNYQYGSRHGTCEQWRMGVRFSKTHFVDGVEHGPREYWWSNGNPRMHVMVANGVNNGKCTVWSMDGVSVHSADYQNGKCHGEYVEYNNAGTLIRRIWYDHGVKHGSSERWNDDGSRIHTKNYANGKLHGLYDRWSNGGLVYRAYYKNGNLDGSVYRWATDGDLYHFSTWVNGVMQT